MRLLIISDMAHYLQDGRVFGWGPTVQEINHLATLFASVKHVACLYADKPPASSLPYSSDSVQLVPVSPTGGQRLRDKLGVLIRFPLYAGVIRRELGHADVVHVRCPANICLVALLLLALSKEPNRRWVKYAGDWSGANRRPLSFRIQRWWLRQNCSRASVTVNGDYVGEAKHVRSFFNPCLTDEDLIQGRELVRTKPPFGPLRLLFIGALNSNKGVLRALDVVRRVHSAGLEVRFEVVGDGPEREALQNAVRDSKLHCYVQMHGWLPRTSLADVYARNHFILLTSRTEGWPKVLSEAMAYGVVPIASAVSCIPEWLRRFDTGGTAPWDNPRAFAEVVQAYARVPQLWEQASLRALEAASHFSYSAYLTAVSRLLLLP